MLTGIVHYTKLNVPAPIALGVDSTGLTWLRPIIKLGAIAGLSSTMLVMLLGQPRIFYSMSRDGLLPPLFGKVHPRFKTPYVTTTMTGVVVAIVAGLFPIATLTQLTSMGTLLAFVMVSIGIWVLAPHRAEPRATVQDAVDAVGADPRRADLLRADARPAARRRGFVWSCGWRSDW